GCPRRCPRRPRRSVEEGWMRARGPSRSRGGEPWFDLPCGYDDAAPLPLRGHDALRDGQAAHAAGLPLRGDESRRTADAEEEVSAPVRCPFVEWMWTAVRPRVRGSGPLRDECRDHFFLSFINPSLMVDSLEPQAHKFGSPFFGRSTEAITMGIFRLGLFPL